MAALNNILDPEFVRFLLVDKNLSYSEIPEEIKSHFPDFKGCSLPSLKRFCSQHGIKKQMPVSNEATEVAVRSTVSGVSYTVFIQGFQGWYCKVFCTLYDV